MSKKTSMKPIAAAIGTAFVLGVAATPASADANPFGMTDLNNGYQQIAGAHEGKCGEGKCGGKPKAKEAKCGEGKCGAKGKAKKEGKCGEGKCGGKKPEAKCGEGKCGGKK